MHADIETLGRLLEDSGRIVVFTGAGVSTESGIPDFRSPGGLWSRVTPIDYQEFTASEEARRRSWELKLEMDVAFSRARPNRGHRAVAELDRRGKCHAVITQNVDGLHQLSGVPDDKVVELHGNTTYAACLSCQRRHDLDPIKEAFRRDGTLPVCDACGGIVKTATISFGQTMPVDAMSRAEAATLNCALFVVLGSSLVVYPAAGFPRLAVESGARLAIVNREPTDLDALADVVVNGEIGPVVGEAMGVA